MQRWRGSHPPRNEIKDQGLRPRTKVSPNWSRRHPTRRPPRSHPLRFPPQVRSRQCWLKALLLPPAHVPRPPAPPHQNVPTAPRPGRRVGSNTGKMAACSCCGATRQITASSLFLAASSRRGRLVPPFPSCAARRRPDEVWTVPRPRSYRTAAQTRRALPRRAPPPKQRISDALDAAGSSRLLRGWRGRRRARLGAATAAAAARGAAAAAGWAPPAALGPRPPAASALRRVAAAASKVACRASGGQNNDQHQLIAPD